MASRRILAADMWVVHNFGDPNLRYQKFLKTGKPKLEKFIDSLLIYDQVVVPTDDFLSIAVLVGILGPSPVLSLAESGALKVARVRGFLAYVGNGGGLLGAGVSRPGEGELPVSAPVDEGFHRIISGLNNVDKHYAKKLTDAFVKITNEKLLSFDDKSILDEVYNCISNSDNLSFKFDGRNLLRLPGIAPNQVMTFDALAKPRKNDNLINIVLRLAQATLETQLASQSECHDVSTANPIGQILRSKQKSIVSVHDGIVRIKDIENIPNLIDVLLGAPAKIDDLIKLRESSSGIAFRSWIHDAMNNGKGDIDKEYISLLKSKPVFSSVYSRTMRFIITTGWSVVEPISGLAAAISDNFLIDKFLARRSPKFFIDKLADFSL